MFFAIFGSNMEFLGVGRCLKSFLEVLRFVVTEYHAVGSHGDLIRNENCNFQLNSLQHETYLGAIWELSGGYLGDLGPQGDPKSDLRVRAFKSVTPLS